MNWLKKHHHYKHPNVNFKKGSWLTFTSLQKKNKDPRNNIYDINRFKDSIFLLIQRDPEDEKSKSIVFLTQLGLPYFSLFCLQLLKKKDAKTNQPSLL
jgi:hypothetical protein